MSIMSSLPPPHEVVVGPQGRIVIPASLRRSLGIELGEPLTIRCDRGAIILERREDLIERLRARFDVVADGPSLADELIDERRAEARREGAD